PSIFGALPYSMPPNSASAAFNYVRFTFSSPQGTIWNSVVTGPRSQKYYRITTDSTERGFSIVQNFGGEIIAVIEWRKHPTVEIFGTVSKRTTEHNTCFHRFRLTIFQGYYCTWTPDDQYIRLHDASRRDPQLLGRVFQGQKDTTIEVAVEALKLRFLKVLVVATLLLICGRNID
ncbi:hypothetical protein B0H13DRAFT_1587498, partial [Mycena leptocephala]